MNKIAEVIIDTNSKAVDRTFDYVADESIKVGMRVKVPFGIGNRPTVGYVVKIKETSDYKNLKRVSESVMISLIKHFAYSTSEYFINVIVTSAS